MLMYTYQKFVFTLKAQVRPWAVSCSQLRLFALHLICYEFYLNYVKCQHIRNKNRKVYD